MQAGTFVLSSKSNVSVIDPAVVNNTKAVMDSIYGTMVDWSKKHKHEGIIISRLCYFDFIDDANISSVAFDYLSQDHRTMIMIINTSNKFNQQTRYNFYEYLRDHQEDIVASVFGYHWGQHWAIGYTSEDAMADDANTVIMEDIERADMFTMPFAFLVLAYMIKR